MDGFTCRDLVLATGGTLLMGKEDTPIRHISLDSRKMEGEDLFVPIIGANVDAHGPLPGLGWRTPDRRFRISAYTAGAARSFR